MKKIPVNVISGFLGSGKTTAIIQLLNQKTDDEPWAVVINEFGKISIDGQTIRTISHSGTVYDISGGCICCSAKGYLYENLTGIVKSGDFSRIIIEPSGLGGIDTVSEIIGNIQELCLMPIICMVDITALENHRLQLNPIYRAQISMAEVIVFSKCDLVGETAEQERLFAKFQTLFPNKLNCLTNENIQSKSILCRDSLDNGKTNGYRMVPLTNPNLADSNYQEINFIFGANAIVDPDLLGSFFADHPCIIRSKGHVRTEHGWRLLNFTLVDYTFDPCQEKEQSEIILIAEKSGSDQFQNFKSEIERTVIFDSFDIL
jgi:G3E family GTPase